MYPAHPHPHPHHHKPQPQSQLPPRPRSRTTTPSAVTGSVASTPRRRGLYAYVGHRVVELLTEQQLVDHAVSVLPQLRSVATRPHFHGPHWTTLRRKHGVDLYEFNPAPAANPFASRASFQMMQPPLSTSAASSSHASTAYSSAAPTPTPTSTRTTMGGLPHGFHTKYQLPNPGIDMAYAVVAQCELEGSVADVVDALFNDDTIEFEGSMRALWGNKLKRGDLLLSRRVPARPTTATAASARSTAMYMTDLEDPVGDDVADHGRLAIKTATVGAGLSLRPKQMGAEKLCYTTYTETSTTANEAFHVIKTLPLDVHDQIACGKTHVALRDPSIDHIAVGYYLTGSDSVLGGARTRLIVCAYVSAVDVAMSPASTRASQLHWHPRMDSSAAFRARSNSEAAFGFGAAHGGVRSDARRVVMMLAKAARDFQQTVRQRRFGNQRFVYFPTERQSCRALEQGCVVCQRRFGIFRKDHYCQLCGHLVCRHCSRKHKVEPLAGKVRENRICFPCVARVDSGTFHDEQLWRNMERAVVVDADVISPGRDLVDTILELTEDTPTSVARGGIVDHDDDMHDTATLGKMTPGELATESEEEEDVSGLDRSFGSAGSTSSPPPSTRRELQVAYDLFSPHPQRRASALEALSQIVLDARNSLDYQQNKLGHDAPLGLPTPRAAAKSVEVTREPIKATRVSPPSPPVVKASVTTTSKGDRLPTFAVSFPRGPATTTMTTTMTTKAANAVLHHDLHQHTALLESASQQRDSARLLRHRPSQQQQQHHHHHHQAAPHRRASTPLVLDTAAFDSICEAVVQRLGYCMAVLVVQRAGAAKPQVVGLHQSPHFKRFLPRHLDAASYCPSGFVAAGSSTPFVAIDPAEDARFRDFALIHEGRIRFFAEFPLTDVAAAVPTASLCVLDTGLRGQHISKQERKTVKTLCAVASDLLSSVSH